MMTVLVLQEAWFYLGLKRHCCCRCSCHFSSSWGDRVLFGNLHPDTPFALPCPLPAPPCPSESTQRHARPDTQAFEVNGGGADVSQPSDESSNGGDKVRLLRRLPFLFLSWFLYFTTTQERTHL